MSSAALGYDPRFTPDLVRGGICGCQADEQVVGVDARIEELGRLDRDALAYEVALESDEPDFTRDMREEALIRAITHLIDRHGWAFSWDPRGLRLTHDAHTFVLGIPAVFFEYLEESPTA